MLAGGLFRLRHDLFIKIGGREMFNRFRGFNSMAEAQNWYVEQMLAENNSRSERIVNSTKLTDLIFAGLSFDDTLLKGDLRPEDLEITVGHRMLDKDTNQFYQGVVFGKTGFTDAAKSTLVTAAKKDGRTLIAVTLSHEDRFKQYKETKALLDYGYGSFYRFVLSKDDLKSMVTVKRSELANIESDFSVILPVEVKRELLTQSVDVIENEIFVTLKGANEDITQKIGVVTKNKSGAWYIISKIFKIIFTIIGILLLLFILFFIYLIYYVNKRNKKRIAERKKKAQIEANYKYYNM